MIQENLPASIKAQLPKARLPVNYESAKLAIAECERVDECREWANRAEALVSYAKQAKDKSLEHTAIRIRTRAQMRLGELLLEYPGYAPGSTLAQSGVKLRLEVAAEVGIGKTKMDRLTRAARVPKGRREELIETTPPATLKTIASIGSVPRWNKTGVSPAWLKLAREGALGTFLRWSEQHDPAQLAKQLTQDEADRIRAYYLSKIQSWLDELERHLPSRPVG